MPIFGTGGGKTSQIFNDSIVPGLYADDALNNLLPYDPDTDFYVSKNGSDSYTGTITRPYLTIQHALNQIPAATDALTMRRVWHIFVETGTYDEALSIDIGRKKVVIVCTGAVSLGQFDNANWAPSGITRNITITCSLVNISSIRCSFGVISLTRIQAYGTHQAYGHNFRVSGSLIISNSTGGTSGELNLQGVSFFGWDGVAAGNNDSITAGSWAGNLNLYADNCRFYGLVTGGVVRLQSIKTCSFEKLATVATYSQIWNSEIKAGMTWTVAPTEVSPSLIACSTLSGTFTGGLGVNLLLDDVSNYFFIANGAIIAGGAAKILISDAIHLAGTETITGDKTFNGKFETPKTKITVEGGFAIKVTNKSGANTVKGYLAEISSGTNNAVTVLPTDAVDPVGVFYDAGIADGQECWVIVAGIADVYYSASTVRDYFARNGETGDIGVTPGMAYAEAAPTPPLATDSHFREIGHVLETRTGAGLAKTILHFN